MNTHAAYAAEALHRLDTGSPVFFQPCQPIEEFISGSVQTTAARQRRVRLALLGLRRKALLHEAQRLRNLRQSKAASICEAELRAVINEILAMGQLQPQGV